MWLDFYLPTFDIAIEYDGIQHFQESSLFAASLEESKLRDKRKERFLEDNGIKLIRIKYTEKLNEELLYSKITETNNEG